jgi:cell division protein FtsB
MRLILICLTALLLLIQLPLWLGKGGWLRVWDMDQQVAAAQRRNDELKARNAKLASEVQDLKQGTGAVEERARFELGMIKDNEIFVQILDPKTAAATAAAAAILAAPAAPAAAPAGKAEPSAAKATRPGPAAAGPTKR